MTDLFGGPVGGKLHDFAWSPEAPLALRDIGLRENDLDLAADLAVKAPYWNPRPVARDAVCELLQPAREGTT